MLVTPINWQLAPNHYNEAVIYKVNHIVKWFEIEWHSLTVIDHNNLKLAVQREMEKLKSENSPQKLIYAILALYYQKYLPNPLNITFNDIENALWIIKNPKYGFSNNIFDTNIKKVSAFYFTF